VVAGLAAATGYSLGGWWALPAFAVWACVIAAGACCDLATLRMPTLLLLLLLRYASLSTLGLVAAAALIGRHSPTALLVGVAVSLMLAGLVWLGWRFGPIGRGDVRLALLGGLPLGFTSSHSLLPAVAAFVGVSLAQAGVALALGGGRKTQVPFGPPLAALFLAAVLFA
jgi:leader peptidase (prepilin peptidase)/N-methyltransferase